VLRHRTSALALLGVTREFGIDFGLQFHCVAAITAAG
jgi:hypothetical protein